VLGKCTFIGFILVLFGFMLFRRLKSLFSTFDKKLVDCICLLDGEKGSLFTRSR
jgi:hypothetical protein